MRKVLDAVHNVRENHEEMFVASFIQKERRERALFLLRHPAKRHEFTAKLAHVRWLDERFVTHITGDTAHTVAELVALLKQNGASSTVWVISENRTIDGQQLPIEDAMTSIWGGNKGTVLSCVPGKLAFLRGEAMKTEYLLRHG